MTYIDDKKYKKELVKLLRTLKGICYLFLKKHGLQITDSFGFTTKILDAKIFHEKFVKDKEAFPKNENGLKRETTSLVDTYFAEANLFTGLGTSIGKFYSKKFFIIEYSVSTEDTYKKNTDIYLFRAQCFTAPFEDISFNNVGLPYLVLTLLLIEVIDFFVQTLGTRNVYIPVELKDCFVDLDLRSSNTSLIISPYQFLEGFGILQDTFISREVVYSSNIYGEKLIKMRKMVIDKTYLNRMINHISDLISLDTMQD